MSSRYVVVGLAHPRSNWPAALSRWSTSGAAPIEYLSCLTSDETRAVTSAGRPASAALLDAASTQIDRDLVSAISSSGAVAIGVDSPAVQRDWDALGCVAVLAHGFTRADLMSSLDRFATSTEQKSGITRTLLAGNSEEEIGRVIAVTGTGGAGSSTVAMALAEGISGNCAGDVLLVDGARRADLAMYHDTGDVLPGLPELVDAFRTGTPDPDDLRELTFRSASRGYDVLLGLRRSRDWASLRTPSIAAALDGLRRTYDTVILDVDPDCESQATTGSADMEDRNALTLAAIRIADAFCGVTSPSMKGLNDLTRLVSELVEAGMPTERLVGVFNRSPTSPASRSRVTAAFARLAVFEGAPPLPPPVHLSFHRSLESCHRDGSSLPTAMNQPLQRAVTRVVEAHGTRVEVTTAPARVESGQLAAHIGDNSASQTGPSK